VKCFVERQPGESMQQRPPSILSVAQKCR